MTPSRSFRPILVIGLLALLATWSLPLVAQDVGTLTGQVVRNDGTSISGVSVIINEVGRAELSDGQGRFRFTNVPAGTYTLSFSLGDRLDIQEGVEVTAGAVKNVTATVDWQVTFAETLVVTGASRRVERVVDAPAAVTIISEAEIERGAATGQVPKLLEFTPGVELTQGGLYDFNVNTRGFNSSLNRRVAVIIDGRDPSVPFLASQEWTAASTAMEDVETMEMLRGPAAALYGSNASSGVINLVTKPARGSEGGLVRLTAGELSTLNADVRYAADLGNEFYFKALAGYREGDTFTVSRRGAAEYAVPCGGAIVRDCLPQEAVEPIGGGVDGWAGSLRLDKYFGDRYNLTFEGGSASLEGATAQTNIGRVQINEIERPWVRVNLNHRNWNALVYRTERDASRQLALSSGNNLVLDTDRTAFELQGNFDLGEDARVVIGGSYREENIDTFDPRTGRQTLVFRPEAADFSAIFGQIDWQLHDRVKLVVAGRFDDSDTFYDSEFSPKAALVFSLADSHSLRLSYNEAFQAPNYTEKFLQADVAAPVTALAPLEGLFCAPFGVSCGFDRGVRTLAVGNGNLGVETVKAFEVGYSGVLNNRAFVTVDYYNSQNRDFISDLISTQFTPLGDFNTQFGSYVAPAGLPAPVAAALTATLAGALGPSFALLTNNLDGSPILGAVSYATFGQVDTQGVDLGLNYYVNDNWTANANYSWFDFEIKDPLPGLEDILSPNSPEHSLRGSVSYQKDRFDAALSGRWVDDYFWATGPFVGVVESFSLFDFSLGYQVNDRIKVGLNVANMLDEEHFETYGGELIGRRALGTVVFNW